MFHQHTHFSHLSFLRDRMNEIYIVHVINMFASAMFGILVPIYLLTLGFSIPDVLGFYMVYFAAQGVLFIATGYIATRLGLKHLLLLRFPFAMATLFLLYSLNTIAIPLAAIAVLGGFQNALYWMPLQSLFARSSKKRKIGSETGKLNAFATAASIAAPLVGAVLTLEFGFGVLFAITAAMVFVSVIPLFYTPEIKPHVNLTFKEGMKIMKTDPRHFAGLWPRFFSDIAETIIWPIFVFLLLDNVLSIGILGTILSASAVTVMFYVGKLSDSVNRKRIIRIGAVAMAGVWLLRSFAGSELAIYALTAAAGIFTILISLPYDSITYTLAKKTNTDEFIIMRELHLTGARITMLIVALVLTQIQGTFVAAGLSHILLLFV